MHVKDTQTRPPKPDALHLYIARARAYLGDLGVAWHAAVHAGDYEGADRIALRYHHARRGWGMGAGRYL